MEEKEILKRTSQVLRDKFVEIEVDIIKTTFLDRLLKKPKTKVFHVRRACLSTLMFFSELVLDLSDATPKGIVGIMDLLFKDVNNVVKVLAVLLTNSDKTPDPKLLKFLKKNLDATDQKAILVFLFKHSKIEDFINSIILVKEMSLLKTEETIASENVSGEQSDQQ